MFGHTTTIYVYTWGFILYLVLAAATMVAMAWIGYRFGWSRGHGQGYRQARHDLQKTSEPTRFRQRTREADPRRQARVRRARMIARRQPKPEPRR
jgi:hypothetical protein